MKGYKVFNSDWTCRGFQYEVGRTYEMEETPIICKQGFHFCTDLKNCFSFYPFNSNKVKIAKVEAFGDCDKNGNKYCTNKIKIVREIPIKDLELVVELKVFNMPGIVEYNVGEIIDSSYYTNIDGFPILEEKAMVLAKSCYGTFYWMYKVQAYVITDVKIKEENEDEGV